MNEKLYQERRGRLKEAKAEDAENTKPEERGEDTEMEESPVESWDYAAEESNMEAPENPPQESPAETADNPSKESQTETPENLPLSVSVIAAETEREESRREADRKAEERRTGKPVVIYILLLFSMALLLMGLSSLVHQRSTLGELGQLRSDLSAMQRVQDFQEKIISLQEARQELEDQLKTMQGDMNGLIVQAQEERGRTEAMRYLYRIQMQYGAGRYQACQVLIEEFEAAGLIDSLPRDSEDNGVPAPLDRYQEIKAANAVQLTEALAPQTGVIVEEWAASPEEESSMEGESPVESGNGMESGETAEGNWTNSGAVEITEGGWTGGGEAEITEDAWTESGESGIAGYNWTEQPWEE